jgi:hypothetical protein
VERVSATERRENAAVRHTHRRIGWGRQRHRRARTRAAGSRQRWSAARVARRLVAAMSERDTRDGAVVWRLSRVIAFTKWLSAKKIQPKSAQSEVCAV